MIFSIFALFTGFILDRIFGDPHNFPHIVRFMGSLILNTEKFMRRQISNTNQGEFLGGAILVCFIMAIFFVIPFILLSLCYSITPFLGYLLESFICYQLLAARSLKTESMKVYYSLEKENIEQARKDLSMIVGRDTNKLNTDAILCSVVETISENTSDGVIAPLFYIVLGGAPLGCLYKAVNTMDSMLGYKNDRYLYFGRIAAKIDDGFNYIPSRICATLMIISAFLLKLDWKNAHYIWRRDRRKHLSPNSAQTEAACAGALGIRLAGPVSYFGKIVDKPYIGDSNRPIRLSDIIHANNLMYITSILMLIIGIIFRIICWGAILYVAI